MLGIKSSSENSYLIKKLAIFIIYNVIIMHRSLYMGGAFT